MITPLGDGLSLPPLGRTIKLLARSAGQPLGPSPRSHSASAAKIFTLAQLRSLLSGFEL